MWHNLIHWWIWISISFECVYTNQSMTERDRQQHCMPMCACVWTHTSKLAEITTTGWWRWMYIVCVRALHKCTARTSKPCAMIFNQLNVWQTIPKFKSVFGFIYIQCCANFFIPNRILFIPTNKKSSIFIYQKQKNCVSLVSSQWFCASYLLIQMHSTCEIGLQIILLMCV